jgi:hypothetical protein
MTKEEKEFFTHSKDDSFYHPLLRIVAMREEKGYTPVFELVRPRESLGFQKAKIIIHFYKNGRKDGKKSDDWDDDLNTGLIKGKVRSKSEDGEKDRFSLGLRAALRRPERRFGDGYFNSVLMEFVENTPFKYREEVRPLLPFIKTIKPKHGESYKECMMMINAAVKGRLAELKDDLEYELPMAVLILAGAMGRYLEERFSVTNRRLLNLM